MDLQRLARMDWRFLLPNPMLREVACLADPTGLLVAALRNFCVSVTHLEGPALQGKQYELVAVENASIRSLRAVAGFVAPDGWLYAEFSRRPGRPASWLQHPNRCCRELRHLGFDSVVPSWHRPNFASCWEIIPLSMAPARTFALSRSSAGWRSHLKFGFGRFLDHSGLLPLVVPCFSVIARRRG